MVIFGATGDLIKRLLVPALYHLGAVQLLPEQFAIVGCAYAELTDAAFRAPSSSIPHAPMSSGQTAAPSFSSRSAATAARRCTAAISSRAGCGSARPRRD